jgi:hypothetical protein
MYGAENNVAAKLTRPITMSMSEVSPSNTHTMPKGGGHPPTA